MNYLYHGVPAEMHGNVIYPLNYLKSIYPDIYENAVSTYKGREEVLKQQTPIGIWSDVVHLLPLHPSKTKEALVNAGFEEIKDIPMKYYEIDPILLKPENTIIHLNKSALREAKTPDNFEAFTLSAIDNMQSIPDATLAYFKEKYEEGKRPLLYAFVPHVLYKGSIDVSMQKIITV